MKFFIETFGCKVNFYESAALQKLFSSKGFVAADSFEDADVVIINCCTVTEMQTARTGPSSTASRGRTPVPSSY